MKRTFRVLSKSERLADTFSSAWDKDFNADGISWPELLKFPRVLLVSQAGAGKTYEIPPQDLSLLRE